MNYRSTTYLTLSAMFFTLVACSPESASKTNEVSPEQDTASLNTGAHSKMNDDTSPVDNEIIDIVTTEYAIEAPKTMDLGWTRFRFTNQGNQTHFVAMYKLVEGKTIEDQKREVAPVFDPLMEGLRSGELTKEDIGPFIEENMPEWGLQMTWVGGAALLAPGRTTHASFKLEEPGTYLLECYVKAPDGQWHTLMGMLQQVTVTDKASPTQEPTADWDISLTDTGLKAPAKVNRGMHTIKVNFSAKSPGFMPYDINLAKLSDDTELANVIHWMDWTNVGGLRAPAPVEFLGGVEHMNAGKHGYMTVELTPGRYLWVSEVNAANMHKEFVVE